MCFARMPFRICCTLSVIKHYSHTEECAYVWRLSLKVRPTKNYSLCFKASCFVLVLLRPGGRKIGVLEAGKFSLLFAADFEVLFVVPVDQKYIVRLLGGLLRLI